MASCNINGLCHSDPEFDINNLESGKNDLVYHDGVLVSGSLRALIDLMLPTSSSVCDYNFIFTFLLTSRLFIDPQNILLKVLQHCQHVQSNLNVKEMRSLSDNTLMLVKQWTEQFPFDFRDECLMTLLKSVTQMCVKMSRENCSNVSQLFQHLIHRLTLLESYENFMSKVKTEGNEKPLCSMKSSDIMDICSSPLVLAQQLTHIELERLNNIGPEEFVQVFIKENQSFNSSLKNQKQTKNLELYIKWFNRLSSLVAAEVCCHLKKKHRVKIIEFFVDAAKECFNIGNFNSLMAIIGGLNMGCVSRLKKTWSKVDKSKLEILEHQMDPSSNFSCYRSTLKAAIWRYDGAVDDREKIIIPFFTLLIKDLHFVNEGCVTKLHNSHINFEKCSQFSKQLEKFNTWKRTVCPFEKDTDTINYILTNPLFSETSLLIASFECEHPESNFEKERFKSMKNEIGV